MRRLNLAIVGLVLATGCGAADGDESTADTQASIVRGTTENGRNYVMNLRFVYNSFDTQTGARLTGNCSGVLYAPRTVLTAAHCINPIRNAGTPNQFTDSVAQTLVYIGNNYAADLQALTTAGGGDPYNGVAAAPAASRWMRADSWETHPSWAPTTTLYADLAVVYLDREPRLPPNNTKVDALPIGRTRLGNSAIGLPFTIVGYGANVAFSADIQQNAGSGIKRSGLAPFVGAPVTNPLPPHPHPGVLIPSVAASLFQLNGNAPNANGCAGDSGGPSIRNFDGQERVWGIGTWTGDFCENFQYETRLDGFLPFLDAAYQKGGQATTVPRLECVATRPGGGLRAYYGYNNQNGVNVSVPYGTNNQLSADTTNARPTVFQHGNHPYAFGVNFTASQTITWKLSPPNSPTTTLNASAASPRCSTTSLPPVCAQSCDAQLAACPGSQTFEDCNVFCRSWETDIGICVEEFTAYNACLATQGTSSFTCDPDFGPFPNEGVCQAQVDAFNGCLGG
jgi:hypothetical protein